MKYAVILNTTKNTSEFRSTKGLYNKHCYTLQQAGYTILSIDVKDPTLIKQQLARLPDGSIGFLWNRMHGSPKSMTAAQPNDITSANLLSLFDWLPRKLTANATLYLDACSTASLKEDFYNNIQFTFAKLTLEMPNVQIVAPSEDCHIEWFSMSADHTFSFSMLEAPRSPKNIAITLGTASKSILKDARNQNIPLASIKENLAASLVKGNCEVSFLTQFNSKLHDFLLDANGYDLEETMILTILRLKKEKDCLPCVQELIERFHVSLFECNPSRKPISWDHATFLSTAICANKSSVVSYLLSKGADPLHEVFRGETLYEFVKKASQEPNLYGDHYQEMLFLIDRHLERLQTQRQTKSGFMPAYRSLLANLDTFQTTMSKKLDVYNSKLSTCQEKLQGFVQKNRTFRS